MVIAQEEIFGPVLSVLTFDELDEAVKIANDTHYGLAAAVWTKDINLAHKTSRALRAGVVWVNCFDEGDMSTPFGGYKQSGSGRDKSIHALDKYVDLKMTWVKLYVLRPLVLGLLLLATSVSAQKDKIRELGMQAAQLRNLSYKPVTAQAVSQKECVAYLMKLLDEEMQPAQTNRREAFLKPLGLMPEKGSMKKIYAELYGDQARRTLRSSPETLPGGVFGQRPGHLMARSHGLEYGRHPDRPRTGARHSGPAFRPGDSDQTGGRQLRPGTGGQFLVRRGRQLADVGFRHQSGRPGRARAWI